MVSVLQSFLSVPLLEAGGEALTETPAATTWDVAKFLENAAGYVKNIGHFLMILAGVVLIIVAVIQIAKGLAGGGRGQVNWVMSIACLLVGGLLVFGGWNLAASVASIGKGTLEEINNGTYASDIDHEAVKGGGGNTNAAPGS